MLQAMLLLPAHALFPPLVRGTERRVIHAGPRDYRSRLRDLAPGDHLVLRAGVYERGLPLHRLQGTATRPITVSGPVSGEPAVFRARRGANTVSLLDVSHLEVSNLELTGDGVPVDAVKAEGHAAYAHYVTLSNLHITGHGASRQNVGISTKCPAYGWRILDNRIEGAGTGMYLGDSDGSAPFVGGLIEGNRMEDTVGYNLQIKHQNARPADGALPSGPSRTIIRKNRFRKSSPTGASGGARPNLLVGHWPPEGPGADDIYLIYGNVFYSNPVERLFQGEGNLAFYNNLLVNPAGDGLAIQPHNDIPRRVWIFHNTIIATGTGLTIHAVPGTEVLAITGNAVFAETPFRGVEPTGDNLFVPVARAEAYLKQPLASYPRLDARALPGRLRAEQPFDVPPFPDANRDLNGALRSVAGYGAYTLSPAVKEQ